jgi:hypothetical protein
MENFTNYNIYDNRASNFSNGIMYHKMEERETSNPSEDGATSKERFFYATYNPQIQYVSNRSYSMEGISVSKYENDYNKGSFVHIINRIRKFFCCG